MSISSEIINLSLKNRTLYSIQIELTTKCNWACIHCYISDYTKKGISINNLKKILKEARKMGVFEITYTGGEMFIRKDILPIISYTRSLGFKVNLLTNISLLDEQIISELKKYYVSLVSCTLFSMDSSIHNSITKNNNSFNIVMNNLMLLKKYNIPVEVKTIILNSNYNEWKKILSFCKENNFRFNCDHDIYFKSNGDNTPAQYRLNKEQFTKMCKELDNIRNFYPSEHKSDEHICEGIRNFLFINADGNVYPCEKFLYKIGNAIEESIENIWNNSTNLIRLQNLKWKNLHECIKCNLSNYCVRCPGTAYLEDGDECGKCSLSCQKAEIRKKVYAG